MGEVYRAHDARLGRDVAIKLLRSGVVAEAERRVRFETEARAASALNHPNIVTIYDIGDHFGQPYMVSELIVGDTVRGILDQGPIPLRRVLDMGMQLADGLSAAHAAGITHRDLKPANLMVTREGRLKILDFGLAKLTPARLKPDETVTEASQPGMVLGTVAYMSPEQARAKPVDFRSDQFSCGIVLHEMLSGKPPFERETAPETLTAILREEAPHLDPSVPAPIRWIIERLLAKEPEDRYTSTRDFFRDIRTVRDRLAEVQTSSGRTHPVVEQPRERKTRLLYLALAAFALVVAGYTLGRLLTHPAPDPARLRFTPLTRDETTEGFPVWSPDAQVIAYNTVIRGVNQIFTRSVGAPMSQQLTTVDVGARPQFWSPDGTQIYFESDHDLWVVGAAGGSPQRVMRNLTWATLHPDGETVALLRDGRVWIASLRGGEARPFDFSGTRIEATSLMPLQFSPDGSSLMIKNLAELWVARYPSGEARRFPLAQIALSRWLPNGRLLVAEMVRGTGAVILKSMDPRSGRGHALWSGSTPWLGFSVSADGNRVAFATNSFTWNLVEIVVRGGEVRVVLARGAVDMFPEWAPSGTHYSFVNDATIWDRSVTETFLHPIATATDLPGCDGCAIRQPTWSPDGSRIAFSAKWLWLTNTGGGRPIRLDPQSDNTSGASFSPDGQALAYFRRTKAKTELAKVVVGSRAPAAGLAEAVPNYTRWGRPGILYTSPDGLSLIAPDGGSRRVLSPRVPMIAGFSADQRQVWAVRRTAASNEPQWQLVSIDLATLAERHMAALNLPPDTSSMSGYSLHPDGKRILTAIAKWPYDIWMLEGLNEESSWSRLLPWR